MPKVTERTKLTPYDIARSWGIAVNKVLTWIHSGELRAIDASTDRKKRPRYLIDVADLKEFEERRRYRPARVSAPRPRPKKEDDGFEMY